MVLEMVPTSVNVFGSGVSYGSAGHLNDDVTEHVHSARKWFPEHPVNRVYVIRLLRVRTTLNSH